MKYFIYWRKSQEAEDRQVLSLEGQEQEIKALIQRSPGIEIAGVFEEAKSAKAPGRPEFNRMIDCLRNGEAEGVIAWHPDRLARNSMDGGQIIFLLDQGILKDMKFCSYSFENSPQGKFMLGIMFSNSKYYSDSLSVNVKRGMNLKLQKGWKPGLALIGYKNCRETGTIVPDPDHFDAVRGMFDLLLSGQHSPSDIHRIVCTEWGYRTPKRKSLGGKSPAISTIYKILRNPFYTGFIRWKTQLCPGSHTPVVSSDEFEQAQRHLGTVSTAKPKKLTFPYTGLFRCGACGLSVTAERKRKPSGREYTYYHCTRVHRTPRCTEPSIEVRKLEAQIKEFLGHVTISPAQHDWFCDAISSSAADMAEVRRNKQELAEVAATDIEKQLQNLTDLRVRDMITDEDYLKRKEALQIELDAARARLAKAQTQRTMFEPAKILELFLFHAVSCFEASTSDGKRRLLEILCSNPKLKGRKALLQAKKPFLEVRDLAYFSRRCGSVRNVRTATGRNSNMTASEIKRLVRLSAAPEAERLVVEIKHYLRRHHPHLLA